MNLLRTSVLNGMAVAVRLGCALVINKVLAVYVGPTGYALIGQFQSALTMIVSIAGGAVAPGVTKATAEHFDDQERQHAVWQAAIRFSLLASLSIGAGLFLARDALALWLLRQAQIGSIFICLAVTLPALAINNLFLAVVNGKKEIGIYVGANIVGSLIGVVATALLAMAFGLYGALVALAINPALTLLATGAMVARRGWFRPQFFWGPIQPGVMRELAGFGLMALTTALVVPTTHILVRDHLTNQLSLAAAGYWQATWKISEIYLSLVTTTLAVYYLPRLAEIRTALELKVEVLKVYRFAMPVVIVSASAIFLLRDFIVRMLFTEEFAPMAELFAWQLTGDVIKIGSWILGYIMIGRAMVKAFMFAEIASAATFLGLVWLFVHLWGLKGVPIAHTVTYVAYWMCLAAMWRRGLRSMDHP